MCVRKECCTRELLCKGTKILIRNVTENFIRNVAVLRINFSLDNFFCTLVSPEDCQFPLVALDLLEEVKYASLWVTKDA